MSYPRLFDFIFKYAHYIPISDFWILCALQVKQVVFEIILEHKRSRRIKLETTSQSANVATFQRHDVSTSGQLKKSQQMSQRRDVIAISTLES